MSDFNLTLIFSTDFLKILKCQISQKSASGSRFGPWGQTDGQTDWETDMKKLIVAFRTFTKAPKIETINSSVELQVYGIGQ